MKLSTMLKTLSKPKASEVLTAYLQQMSEPPWTSYFVKLKDVENDHKGRTSYNWTLESGANYHVLRTWCWPYIKFHCSQIEPKDLGFEDKFFRLIKMINLGIPLVMYGFAAIFLIKHVETVNLKIPKKSPDVKIYFLYPEDKGARY
ncbi:unnamed protein product [Diamesa hyperborea]